MITGIIIGLLTGFILTYFIPKLHAKFVRVDNTEYYEFIQTAKKTVIKNQN